MTSTRPDRVQSNSVRNSLSDWQNYYSMRTTRIFMQACCVKWPVTSITWTVHCPISALIKTIAKFSNVIGNHQLDLSTNRTVFMFVIGQCNRTVKGTLNTSCLCKWTERVMYCCLAFRRVTVAFFSFSLFNENLEPQPMSCFFFKFWYDYRTVLDSARSYLAVYDQWRSKFYYRVNCICHI